MNELHRPRLLRRDPGGDRRRAAHRPLDGHADAHAAGRHPRRAPTRRTATPSTSCSSRPTRRSASTSRSQAFDLAERFQTPVFMLSDLDIGMNDWVVPAAQVGRQLPARPRPGARRADELEKLREVPPLRRPRTTDHVAARTLPGRAREGRVLHARLGPQQVRRLHRDPRRVPGGHGPPGAQAQGRRQGGARAGRSTHADRRARSASSRSAAAIRRVREAIDVLAERGIVADYMRIRGFPFGDRRRAVPRRARSHLRRRAEPRRAAPLAAHARDRVPKEQAATRCWSTAASRCRSRHVVDGVDAAQLERRLAMPSIAETSRRPPAACSRNELGLTLRDYEGAMSTLCAGCGHDSVTAAHRARVLGARHAAAHDREAVAASAARRRRRPTS